jgi:hypothetical protein
VISAGLAVADDADDFNKAKARIQQKLRNKQAAYRAEGIREAGRYATLEAARLLVKPGLGDQADEVRKAAYEGLLEHRQQPEIADLLHREMKTACKAGIKRECLPLLALAAFTEDADRRAELIDLLDDVLGTPKADPLLMAGLVDSLAEEGLPPALVAFDTLMETRHCRESFAFRRTLVQGLTRLRHKEAIDKLLELLPALRGETLIDALVYLSALSGKSFGADPPQWQQWWKQNRETFEFPRANIAGNAAGARSAAMRQRAAHETSYYNFAIHAGKIVFIIDTSSSMAGGKMAAAQQSLSQAVQSLPGDAQFNIVAFNKEVFPWRTALVPATAENKRRAQSFVGGLQVKASTSTYDALQRGLAYAPEAIYLVTDGVPTSGKIVARPEIVAAISAANRATRCSIYTVGIQIGGESRFLQELAANNWGEYRDVPN